VSCLTSDQQGLPARQQRRQRQHQALTTGSLLGLLLDEPPIL
jgi:hypothetical protein